MVWGLNKKTSNIQVAVSLADHEVRLFLLEKNLHSLKILNSYKTAYTNHRSLQDECSKWFRLNKCKGLTCHWLLSRNLYKTFNVKLPEVPDPELNTAVKWLIKDQIEQSLDSILTTHYKPFSQDKTSKKLAIVVTEKLLIENLIEITKGSDLQLASIQINELAPAKILADLEILNPANRDANENKIIGFIDEDSQGLIYNFYLGSSFAFTRHIKGRFFPKNNQQEFSLENDNRQLQLDQFLLETQRTLDYCVSQIFRKPVDALIVDASKTDDPELITALEQITELPITRLEYANTLPKKADEISSDEIIPDKKGSQNNQLQLSLAEAGIVFEKKRTEIQSVNFYLNQYKSKPLEFGFKFATSIAAVFMLVFIGFGYIQGQEIDHLNQQLTHNKKELIKTQDSIKKIQKQRSKNNSLENIQKKIIKKQRELVSSKKLLAKVSNEKHVKPIKYSSVLTALSQQNINSLWLTKIDLYPETISLTGQTIDPSSIPVYISHMADNDLLSSEFEDFKIERDKDDYRILNFSMSNGRYTRVN